MTGTDAVTIIWSTVARLLPYRWVTLFTAALCLSTSGCEDPPDPEPIAPMVAPEPPAVPSACDEDDAFDPGPTMPRRLSQVEYVNTVRDLLGDEIAVAVVFPPDEEMLGYDNNASGLQVSPCW